MKPSEMTFQQIILETNRVACLQTAFKHVGDHVCPPLMGEIEKHVDRAYMATLSEEDKDKYLDMVTALHPELLEAQHIISHMTEIMEAFDEWLNTLKSEFDQRKADGVDTFVVEDAHNTSSNDPITQGMLAHLGMKMMDKADFLERFYGTD